ncbi:MAG: phosphatase PAP2 family protein [Rhizobiaceae bacterium]
MHNVAAPMQAMIGTRQRSAFSASAWANIRADAPLYLAIAAYTILGLVFLDINGFSHLATYSTYLGKWLMVFGFVFPVVTILCHYGLLIHRFDRRRMLAAKRIFGADNAAYFASGLCLLMSMMIFQGTFTSVKNGLAAWHGGFPLERHFADIDKALHFGVDPWRYLFAFAENETFLSFVEWNYGVLWFVICFGVMFYMVTSARTKAARSRYVLSFMLTWIVVGNIAAGIFMCAGPAYYGLVTGDTARFGDQLAFLAKHADYDGSAAYYQNYLWMLYERGMTGFGSGISAFPSMHVAFIMLTALFVWERSRLLGLAAFAYVAFINASSVYLAWHYAVDGYASIILTLGIYYALRRLAPDNRLVGKGATARADRSLSIATSAQPAG